MKRTIVYVTIPHAKIEIVTQHLPVHHMGSSNHIHLPERQKILIDGIPDSYIELMSSIVDSVYMRTSDRMVQLKIDISRYIEYRANLSEWEISAHEQVFDLIDYLHYKYKVSCNLNPHDYIFANR